MKLYCDNESTINIAYNPIQHDLTKHIEVHFIKKKLDIGLIWTLYILTNGQLTNILTKGLANKSFQEITSKLRLDNILLSNLWLVMESNIQCFTLGWRGNFLIDTQKWGFMILKTWFLNVLVVLINVSWLKHVLSPFWGLII